MSENSGEFSPQEFTLKKPQLPTYDVAAVPPTAENRMTRRALLQKAGLSAGVVAGLISPHGSQEAHAQSTEQEVQLLKESLEKKYQIDLTTKFAVEELDGKKKIFTDETTPQEWDKDRLEMLQTYLSLLPEYFSSPVDDKKLIIQVENLNASINEGGKYLKGGNGQDFINLQPEIFNKELADDPYQLHPSLRILTHELGHRVFARMKNNTDETTGVAALGIDYEAEHEEIITQLPEKFRSLQDDHDSLFYSPDYPFIFNHLFGSLNYAFSHAHPGEVYPELAAYYLFSHEVFVNSLSAYLPKESIERAYDFLRTELFQGKEYNTHPLGYPPQLS